MDNYPFASVLLFLPDAAARGDYDGADFERARGVNEARKFYSRPGEVMISSARVNPHRRSDTTDQSERDSHASSKPTIVFAGAEEEEKD